jgi:TPR repeat protein
LAAEQNHDFAQEQLGQIYSEGVLVKKDKKLAKKWFKKANHKQ